MSLGDWLTSSLIPALPLVVVAALRGVSGQGLTVQAWEEFKRTATETALGPPDLRSGRSEAIRDLQGTGGQAHVPLE